MAEPNPAGEQLCALLAGLKTRRSLTYEQLAERASCGRGTVQNYLTKPGHRRDLRILQELLTALGAADDERAEALRLHRLGCPDATNPAEVGWAVAARAADCTVWEMAQFTPAEAAVHTAIGRRAALPGPHQLAAPPPYVPRVYDTALRADIAAAACGELSAMIVLRGGSSTGKTRSLFEAVHALCPDAAVVRPRSPAAMRGLADSGLLERRACVVWLNELQGFLGPNGTGLSLDVLRALFTSAGRGTSSGARYLVVVATLWPEKLHDATATGEDRLSDNRDLLIRVNEWVRWHDVPVDFLASERASARALAVGDVRLDRALSDPDRVGFAQTLAGAYELLQHYNTAPRLLDRLLLDAAADARRLGHTRAMTTPLLCAMALALWREERGPTSPPPDWFAMALAYATEPLRSTEGVHALIPLDADPYVDNHSAGTHGPGVSADNLLDDGEGPIGYDLADYIEEHLTRARRRRPITDAAWAALRRHSATPEDLIALAQSAANRGCFIHAEGLYRAAGTPAALRRLADWLAKRPGREDDVDRIYREAAAAGDPDAPDRLIGWLQRQSDQGVGEEAVYRAAAAAGDARALRWLAVWLARRPERAGEVEQAYREAAAAGDRLALRGLGDWLVKRGREDEAEQVYREALTAGEPEALQGLADWLVKRGREDEVEQVYREALTAGHRDALRGLIDWLVKRGREDEVEQVYMEAIAADYPDALSGLAAWLQRWPGREDTIELIYQLAVAAGHRDAPFRLATWLERWPGREDEVEQAYRQAATTGDPKALNGLAAWLAKQPGREGEVEQAYRQAAAAGKPHALIKLANWLTRQPGREDEVIHAYRESVAAGNPLALRDLVAWMAEQGRESEVEQVYREALAAGEHNALRGLVDWLVKQGREDEAEQVYRQAVAADYPGALYAFASWLKRGAGGNGEVEQLYRQGVAAGYPDALTALVDWLKQQPGREHDAEQITRHGLDSGKPPATT